MKADSVHRESLGLCPSSFARKRMPSQPPLHTSRIRSRCQIVRACVCVCVRANRPSLPSLNTSAALLRQLRFCFPVMLPFTLHILNVNRKVCLHAATKEFMSLVRYPLHLVCKKGDVLVVPEKMLGRTFTRHSRW